MNRKTKDGCPLFHRKTAILANDCGYRINRFGQGAAHRPEEDKWRWRLFVAAYA